MFKVNVKKRGLVEIKFTHYNPAKEGQLPSGELEGFGTECMISKANMSPLALGETFLHPLDFNSYCKETGRKIALRRALANLGIGKAERAVVWNTYFATKEKHRSSQVTRTLYEKEQK